MLTHDMTDDGKFRVTQSIMGFRDTSTMTVVWSADLMQKQVNDDPIRLTTQSDRDRFEKVHRHKYNHEAA